MSLSELADLWSGVARLVDRAPSLADLRVHRLHLFAARRWRHLGVEIPGALALEELIAIGRTAAAEEVLQLAREAYEGRLLVLKGPEVALRYPDPTLRTFTDLDLLADNPEAAQRALLAAGFRPIGRYAEHYYTGLHHLQPLELPGSAGPWVEIHRRPNWVDWAEPPRTEELFATAVPSRTGVPGLLALPDEYHALVLAAHSWTEMPLRRVLDLVDVLAVTHDADRARIRALASAWHLTRLWRTTIEVADALLLDRPMPLALRSWGRDLLVPRDRTIAEAHIRRLLSPFWAQPSAPAGVATLRALVHTATPAPDEAWANKLLRVRAALAHPMRRTTEHGRVLGPDGIQPRHKRR